MPITITTTVYDIDELDPDAKKKALDKHRDFNTDDEYWYKPVFETWEEKLKALGFEGIDIRFTGFWNQGDGASFTADEVDIRTFLKAEKIGGDYRSLLGIIQHDWSVWGIVERSNSHYCHENTVSADLETDYDGNEVVYERVESQMMDLEKYLTKRVRELSKEIYCDLEKEYEYQTGDEQVVESLKANEVYFHKDGTWAREVNYAQR